MFCKKCGKKLEDSMQFCPYCGAASNDNGKATIVPSSENIAAPSQDSSHGVNDTFVAQDFIQYQQRSSTPSKKRKSHKILILAGIIVLCFFISRFFGNSGYDMEYSNNEGTKLPIVVTGIEISEENYSLIESLATFHVTNLKNTDYKYAEFAVLAWDNDGFPMKLDQPYVFSTTDLDHDYADYFSGENIRANTSQSYECGFDFKISDIGYMSVFLVYCEDFASKTWENPIANHWEEIEGRKLEDINIYYFSFQQQ